MNVVKASAALLAASPADEQLPRGKKSTKPQKAFHSTRGRGELPSPGLVAAALEAAGRELWVRSPGRVCQHPRPTLGRGCPWWVAPVFFWQKMWQYVFCGK